MKFGTAVEKLKKGNMVARTGWNGKGMWLGLQVPDAHSKMSLPYIFMRTADAKLVPWLASQTDILSDDWVVTRPLMETAMPLKPGTNPKTISANIKTEMKPKK